jgi:hypothetical protein
MFTTIYSHWVTIADRGETFSKLRRPRNLMLWGFVFIASCSVYEPLRLDDETFTYQVDQAPITFVLVCRSDVSFCQETEPKFRAVAEVLKEKCQFVFLEANVSTKTREHYHVIAFPSLFLFRGSAHFTEYKSERDVPHMLAYLRRVLGDRVTILDNARDVHDYLEDNQAAVILAGDDLDLDLVSTFTRVADSLSDDIPFAIASSADAVQQLGLEEVPSLRLHRNEDRTIVDFPLAFSITDEMLHSWILENMVPRYHARDSVIFRNLAFDPRPSVLGFVDTSRKASLDSLHATFERLVEDYGTNFTYIYSDIFDMGHTVLGLGFSGAREPVYLVGSLTGGDLHDHVLFPERRQATPSSVSAWVGQVMNNTLRKSSGVTPIESQTGPLFELSFDDQERYLLAPGLDVAVLYVHPDDENKDANIEIMRRAADEFARQKIESVRWYFVNVTKTQLVQSGLGSYTSSIFMLVPAGTVKQRIVFQDVHDSNAIMNGVMVHGATKVKVTLPGFEQEL